MENYSDWGANVADVFERSAQAVVEHLPGLLGALVLLLIGLLVARLLRSLAIRVVRLARRAASRLSRRGEPLTERSERMAGSLVFWVVMLLFLTAATHALGLTVFTNWLERVMTYLPTLLAGLLIMVAGFMAGALARDLIEAAAPGGAPQRTLLARVAQGVIVLTAVVTGADQIGIDVTFLMIIAAVVAAALLGGMALAVSLGARTFVGNLFGARNLRQLYAVGQTIRVGDYEGRVLEFTATTVVLETTAGRVSLPARLFDELPSTLRVGAEPPSE